MAQAFFNDSLWYVPAYITLTKSAKVGITKKKNELYNAVKSAE